MTEQGERQRLAQWCRARAKFLRVPGPPNPHYLAGDADNFDAIACLLEHEAAAGPPVTAQAIEDADQQWARLSIREREAFARKHGFTDSGYWTATNPAQYVWIAKALGGFGGQPSAPPKP